jgi:hypothetical protein
MMTAPRKFPLVKNPIGPAPPRRPGSIRRTSTIDTSWPDGYGKPMVMKGHARDVWTPVEGGAPVVLAEDRYTILASPAREILSIEVTPDRPHAQQLLGVRGGGQSRTVLMEIMAEERSKGEPIYLILDDFAGASLVSGWIWSRWVDDWTKMAEKSGLQSTAGKGGNMEGVCTGFSPGSSALVGVGGARMKEQSCTIVPSLINPDDPDGWHTLPNQDGVGMRRARRIDVWADGDAFAIDVGFQDSGTQPDSDERMAIHEYHVSARTNAGALADLKVDARILPFQECPGAVAHAQRMLGAPLSDLRTKVLDTLPGILGCTHLNDVLRSMAEVPQLAAQLRA